MLVLLTVVLSADEEFSSFGFHFESRCVWYRTTVFNRYYKSRINWSQMSLSPVVSVCKYTLGTCSQFHFEFNKWFLWIIPWYVSYDTRVASVLQVCDTYLCRNLKNFGLLDITNLTGYDYWNASSSAQIYGGLFLYQNR